MAVQISVRVELSRCEVFVFRCDSINFHSDSQEIVLIVVHELVQQSILWSAYALNTEEARDAFTL